MFQFDPYALLMLLASLISAILAITIWRRRPGPGLTPYAIMLAAVCVWSLANMIRLIVANQTVQYILLSIAYLGITTVPAAWLAFALQYTGRGRFLTRTLIGLFFIEPILTQIAIITNPSHMFFFNPVTYEQVGEYWELIAGFSTGFWIHAVYSYILILLGTIILIAAIIRSPKLYRGQIGWLLVACFAPWVANALTIFYLSPLPDYVDLTPMAFTITGLATAWAMYRFRLMDIMPVAKDVVVKTMADALFVLDSRDRVVDANPAALALLASDTDAVMWKPVKEVFAGITGLLEQVADRAEETVSEVSVKKDAGESIFASRLSPILDQRGEISGQVILLHDITDLKRANAEMAKAREIAEAANQLKSQFLANMSHELRTPLNAIIGYAQLQLAGMAGDLSDEVADYQERILVNAQDLLRLINDVLDVSKIEAGRMELVNRPYNLTDMMNDVYKQFAVLAESKGVNFRLELDEALPGMLIGDEVRTKQIAVNLVSNATKFTSSGEVILKTERVDDDHWRIVVTDTGVGIPAHLREVIFDEFRQVDSGSTREYGGTGLGLAIVRRLVLMMDGTIQVKSEVGEGSTFTVTLPLVVEPEAVGVA